MYENIGRLWRALAIVFGILLALAYFVPFAPHYNWGGENSDNGGNDGESYVSDGGIYPELVTAREDISELEKQYSKDGYRFIKTNANRAGPVSVSWLNKVQRGAEDKMVKTDRSDSKVLNDYLHNAIVEQNAAALEDYQSGNSYPDGHNMVILVKDQGDIKAVELSRDDTSIDTDNLHDVYDILSKPEAQVSESEAKSLLDQVWDRFNQTKSESEPKTVYVYQNGTKSEIPPAIEQPAQPETKQPAQPVYEYVKPQGTPTTSLNMPVSRSGRGSSADTASHAPAPTTSGSGSGINMPSRRS